MDTPVDQSKGDAPSGTAAASATPRLIMTGVAIVLLCALSFYYYSSDQADDTHITYWEVFSLAKFGKILSYNGTPLETSSSLAHAVIMAAVHRATGIAIPTLGAVIPALFGAFAVYLGGRLTARVAPRFAYVGALLIALTPWLLFWEFAGLDAPIAAAAVVAVTLSCGHAIEKPSPRAWILVALSMGLAIAARPEGTLVLGATLLGGTGFALLRARRFGRPLVRALAPYAKIFAIALPEIAALFLWRKATFHVWMPNAVYAKVETIRVSEGLSYIWRHTGLSMLWVFLGVALAGIFQLQDVLQKETPGVPPTLTTTSNRAQPDLDFAISGCVAILAFVVAAGGDWMYRGRFLVPMVAIAIPVALAAIDQVVPAAARSPKREGPINFKDWELLVSVTAIGLVASYAATSEIPGKSADLDLKAARENIAKVKETYPDRSYSFFEVSCFRHYRDIFAVEALEEVLKALAPMDRQPVVATRQAGFVPYHAARNHFGNVKIIDLLNLATDEVRKCAPDMMHRLGDATDNPMNGFYYAVGLNADTLLEKRAVFEPCGLIPDVIYDLGQHEKLHLTESGYVIVFEQEMEDTREENDAIVARREERGHARVRGERSYIAVRKELVEKYRVPVNALVKR